ncbi:MAG: hypothetical protein ACK5MJ_07825 [Alphaproteobacteria bacterium]
MEKSTDEVFGINLSEEASPDWVDLSENHEMVWNLLQDANGFPLFGGALIILPSIKSQTPWATIEDVNHGLAEIDFLQDQGLMAFAMDLFGFLFFVSENGIYHMETEDAKLELVAEDINGFLLELAENGDYWSGQSLMKTWEGENQPLTAGERLAAKKPFIFGGDFEASNLYNQPLEKIIPWYHSLHEQLKDVEDGAVIQLSVPDFD